MSHQRRMSNYVFHRIRMTSLSVRCTDCWFNTIKTSHLIARIEYVMLFDRRSILLIVIRKRGIVHLDDVKTLNWHRSTFEWIIDDRYCSTRWFIRIDFNQTCARRISSETWLFIMKKSCVMSVEKQRTVLHMNNRLIDRCNEGHVFHDTWLASVLSSIERAVRELAITLSIVDVDVSTAVFFSHNFFVVFLSVFPHIFVRLVNEHTEHWNKYEINRLWFVHVRHICCWHHMMTMRVNNSKRKIPSEWSIGFFLGLLHMFDKL
jgi:hypothetical protein